MARIVFIDDDRRVRDLVCATLEQHGYRIRQDPESPTSCVLLASLPPVRQPADSRASADGHESFVVGLLRALSAWST